MTAMPAGRPTGPAPAGPAPGTDPLSSADDDVVDAAEPAPVVLLVDDRPENLLALEAVLEPLGLRLLRATSGEDALRCLLADDLDDVTVIVLDVQMPGMDGFETARHIKAREKTRHIPIVFLTAISTEPANALRGYETGAVDYVAKPFDPVVLRAKVSVLVELHQHTRTIERQRVLLAERLAERDAAQAALARQTLELERSNAELERFAQLLSTDLRQPMHLVAGFIDLLAERHAGSLDDEGRLLVDRARHATERLFTTVDQLLAYARVTTEGLTVEPVELDGVVEEVRRSLRGRLDESRATLSSDPLPTVVGDRWALIRLLTHLVANAVQHTRPGVDIHVGLSRRDDLWVISVRDDGPGMAAERLGTLFTVLAAEGSDGPVTGRRRGAGLAIARAIVERHGGTIWADSVPEQGTTVSFTLPIAPDPAEVGSVEVGGRP